MRTRLRSKLKKILFVNRGPDFVTLLPSPRSLLSYRAFRRLVTPANSRDIRTLFNIRFCREVKYAPFCAMQMKMRSPLKIRPENPVV